jgi:hypothetical protein
MQRIKDEVKRILTDAPYTRDNDKKLTAIYWYWELEREGLDWMQLSTKDFLAIYSGQGLTDAQTITRLRRQLQMKHPELRGEKYKTRMANQEKVKEDLGYKIN